MKAILGTAMLVAMLAGTAQAERTKGYLVAAADQVETSKPRQDKAQAEQKIEAFKRPNGIQKRPPGAVFSSLDEGKAAEAKEVDAHAISFVDAEATEVLDLYQELSGRNVIRSGNLPQARVTFNNELPLSRRAALQTLDTVLAGHGIAMIVSGAQNIKAVAAKEAPQEAAPIIDWLPERLPDSSTYIIYVVHTREDQTPRELAPMLQPLAKMPNSIIAMDQAHMLVLRDYSCNIRQMLQMIDRLKR